MKDVKHFLEIDDLKPSEITQVLEATAWFKKALNNGESHKLLPEKTLGMFFEKPSTRTRISFETGMTHLGGHAIFFGPDDTQLSRGEPLSDTARVVSGYVDLILARVFSHEDLKTLAQHSSVPVINGLSDEAHPAQILSDLFTIHEKFGGFDGVKVAWVGDGNNVAQSLVKGCSMVDLDLTMATPKGYEPNPDIVEDAAASKPVLTNDPLEAVKNADVVYTDVWVSMGDENAEEKKEALKGFQVNADLLSHAPDNPVVMHCLPAHRGEEITHGVLESDSSIVWEQAENRLHAQKALMAYIMGKDIPKHRGVQTDLIQGIKSDGGL